MDRTSSGVRVSEGAAPVVNEALDELRRRDALGRAWARDPALWKPESTDQREIADRLGWLTLPTDMQAHLADLEGSTSEARTEGVRHVVLCGMGGSSLAPEVFQMTFGSAGGYPELIVLDSTDPGAVRNVDARIDPAKTLFLISSKSGGTIEVLSFLAHFWEAAGGDGGRFCAITDPDTGLDKLATARGFRRIFRNPPDIGGRYSALSLFGLVPAALTGVDVGRLLRAAAEEQSLSAADAAVESVPGVRLGAFMGGLARQSGDAGRHDAVGAAKRDKLTLLTSPGLASFGPWVEQLIAESTGKEGTGILPVVGEPLAASVDAYGDDRAFVLLQLEGDETAELDRARTMLGARFPMLEMLLPDVYHLGAQMYRWEMATAFAGALLNINPFDQPNVQESKDNTARVLQEARARGGAVEAAPAAATFQSDDLARFNRFLEHVRPGDYLALQAYLTPRPETEAALQALRVVLRDRLRVATTLGFGPRFLHSTGQLHKGGRPNGVFLQFVQQHAAEEDLAIPGQSYTFGTLIAAQALGDLQSLRGRGLRAARVDLGTDVAAGLRQLTGLLTARTHTK